MGTKLKNCPPDYFPIFQSCWHCKFVFGSLVELILLTICYTIEVYVRNTSIAVLPIIGVRAPSDLGGGGGRWPYCPKKLDNTRKHVLYKRTQVAVKTKTLTILTPNKRIIIPKLLLNPDFSNLQGKPKLVRKIGYFEKSEVTKITEFLWSHSKRLFSEPSQKQKSRSSFALILSLFCWWK